MRSWGNQVLRAGAVLLPLALGACQTLIKPCGQDGCALTDCCRQPIAEPGVCATPTMRALACDLDLLERHIESFGSVVAKVPDVWGQARLTTYRDEFEKVMAPEADKFNFVLNGSEARSDQAFLASATALSFAAQPAASAAASGPSLVPTSRDVMRLYQDPATGGLKFMQTSLAPPSSPAGIQPLPVDDPSTLVSDTDTVIQRNPAQLPKALGFQGAGGAIGLEPTEFLAQKQRYLNFLHQLRRENEGADTADSPGYSLNLLRIPVSVLPGKKTEVGYGAEITMSLDPILGDDLLPMTFRNLLVNDVQTQLGFPLTQILGGDKDFQKLLTPEFQRFIRIITRLNDYLSDPHPDYIFDPVPGWGKKRKDALVKYLNSEDGEQDRKALVEFATVDMKSDLRDLGVCIPFKPGEVLGKPADCKDCKDPMDCPKPGAKDIPGMGNRGINSVVPTGAQAPAPKNPFTRVEQKWQSSARATTLMNMTIQSVAPGISTQFSIPSISFSNGLDNRTAFPSSQMIDVYGSQAMFDILYAAQRALKPAIDRQGYAHLPDVQAFLREESRASAEFLRKNQQLWSRYSTDTLVRAIRSQRWEEVTQIRQAFRKEVAFLAQSEPDGHDCKDPINVFDPETEPVHLSRTTGLAWCLIVDAALLNDRLIQDMKETATSKGKRLDGCDHWCQYFLPEPLPECRRAFNEYVKLRWPIHVFALDPYIQEQNIADSFSTRRETQLALAIAFTNGLINAQNLTKYTRRLEAEYETIALNRTQVGFSHGENTFGWRFYPRYQTPDTKSNLEVLVREQIIGGPTRNQLLRDRRLEPGMRECVAIVMMPSFVPYVTVSTESDWFSIANPKHKCLPTTQAVQLSHSVQAIKTGSCNVQDACNYRPGEFDRLVRRAEQLEERLPTQTLTSPVPILNTLGGFEMFSNGTTDLAPELFGWYGAPGIDPEAESTTLFLVGDHFSPLRTHVIVGNQAVAHQRMLSRQVMQVTFTKGAYSVGVSPDGTGGEVRIHLATPYGVTRELAVPVAQVKPAPKPGFSFAGGSMTASYGMLMTEPGKFRPVPKCDGSSSDLKIGWNNPGGIMSAWVTIEMTFEYTPAGEKKPVTLKVPCRGVLGGATAKEIVIPKEHVNALAAELVRQFAAFGPFPVDKNPLDAALKTKTVTITPLVPPGTVAQVATTADSLTVKFKAEGVCLAQQPAVCLEWIFLPGIGFMPIVDMFACPAPSPPGIVHPVPNPTLLLPGARPPIVPPCPVPPLCPGPFPGPMIPYDPALLHPPRVMTDLVIPPANGAPPPGSK